MKPKSHCRSLLAHSKTPALEIKAPESTADRNLRVLGQAMKKKKRLSLDDAQFLAAGFCAKRAASEMWKAEVDNIRKDLEQLERDCTERRRLAGLSADSARDSKNSASCHASAVVWLRTADLIAGLLRKHFPQNLAECGAEPQSKIATRQS